MTLVLRPAALLHVPLSPKKMCRSQPQSQIWVNGVRAIEVRAIGMRVIEVQVNERQETP
jgi:hypothetical protein